MASAIRELLDSGWQCVFPRPLFSSLPCLCWGDAGDRAPVQFSSSLLFRSFPVSLHISMPIKDAEFFEAQRVETDGNRSLLSPSNNLTNARKKSGSRAHTMDREIMFYHIPCYPGTTLGLGFRWRISIPPCTSSDTAELFRRSPWAPSL